MAYTKTTWQTGDVITAVKLNNAEDGIEAHDPMIITTTNTWQSGDAGQTITYGVDASDVYDAVIAGKQVIVKVPDQSDGPDLYAQIDGTWYASGDDIYYLYSYALNKIYFVSYFDNGIDGKLRVFVASGGME